MTVPDWIAIGLATMALVCSIIALWKTHLSRFSPIFTAGMCTFRIYSFGDNDERRYIPSLTVPISITNSGARSGKLEDIRIAVTFPDLPIPTHYEMFYAKWDVDPTAVHIHDGRAQLITDCIIAAWTPFTVLPKTTETKHLVFESHWDDPVIQPRVLCTMEVRTSSNPNWTAIAKWTFHLEAEVWHEMADVGSSFSDYPDSHAPRQQLINPPDLHKYTGSKEYTPSDECRGRPCYLEPSSSDDEQRISAKEKRNDNAEQSPAGDVLKAAPEE